jgi:hypothetical protein
VMRKTHFSMMLAAALVGGSSIATHAQIGNGWTRFSPTKTIQRRGPNVTYTNSGGVETFTMRSGDERSEARVHDDYKSGRRQFEGYVRVSDGQGTSVHQIFKFLMLVYYPDNGGELRQHSYQHLATTGIRNVWLRVNTLHDTRTHKAEIYINGSRKGTMNDKPWSSAGGWYHKYGVYNCRTFAKAEWRDVKFFR